MPRQIAGMTLYTVQEIAAHLDKTPKTIRAYIRDKKLHGRKVGREYLIPEDSLRTFLSGEEEEEEHPAATPRGSQRDLI